MAGGALTLLSLAGTAVSAIGTIAAGNAQSAMATYQAKVYDIKAQEEKAAGYRDAMEQRRRAKLAEGRLKNVAAASGFTATDPTALTLLADLGGRGEYNAQVAEYGGLSREAGYREQSAISRAEAKSDKTGALLSAGGTILSGIGGMFQNYGGGGYLGAGDPNDPYNLNGAAGAYA